MGRDADTQICRCRRMLHCTQMTMILTTTLHHAKRKYQALKAYHLFEKNIYFIYFIRTRILKKIINRKVSFFEQLHSLERL